MAEVEGGVVVGYHESATNKSGLFKLSFVGNEAVSTELPACDVWSGNVLTSSDGDYVLCQTYSVISDTDFKDVKRTDSFTFRYERKIIDLTNLSIDTVNDAEYTVTGLGFNASDGMDEESYGYFLGLGLPRVAYESGEWVIGWLKDNRFLMVDQSDNEDIGNRFDPRTRHLYIDDFQGNRVPIDSGEWNYTYLGELKL